jgi:transposase
VVVVDDQGVPIGAQLAPANISEFRLAESTLERVRLTRRGRGRPRKRRRRVIADKGYDSDPLRQRLRSMSFLVLVIRSKRVQSETERGEPFLNLLDIYRLLSISNELNRAFRLGSTFALTSTSLLPAGDNRLNASL